MRIMSSVLSFLVGKSTSCSRLQSAMVSRNVVFTRRAYSRDRTSGFQQLPRLAEYDNDAILFFFIDILIFAFPAR